MTGIEPSKEAAQIANKKGCNVKVGFYENMVIPNNKFDLVVLSQTLEHLENPLFISTYAVNFVLDC